jgi:hypothetical protein
MKLSIRFFSSLYISLLCASVSSSVLATQTEKPERWFEIEVILFHQLGDKKALKEQFPDNVNSTNLPQYKKHFDLLTPYLQPDLASIKQFIPLCTEAKNQHDFLELLPKINLPFSDTLKIIEQVDTVSVPELKAAIQQTGQEIELSKNNTQFKDDNFEKIAQSAPDRLIENLHNSLTLEQQRKLVLDRQEELTSPIFSTQNICIISRNDIKKLFTDEHLANMSLDAFNIEALATKLDASGSHISKSPYLIADKSLLLADIKQRLQWSKEFKPLLHFGWRQIGVTRDKAIPLKLFAGEHLDYQYQQALDNYQSARDDAKLAEQLIFQQSDNIEPQEIDDATAEITQQQLTKVFNELDTVDSANIDNLIHDLEPQTLEELIVINEVSGNGGEQLNITSPPEKPLQPWFLDGFFKVHLDHYLYITADFNVLSQSLDKSTTNNATNNSNVKLINFSQKKRAITGEIHYFDNPFIGMIVQIRRFDPSKPEEEAVTQVIN